LVSFQSLASESGETAGSLCGQAPASSTGARSTAPLISIWPQPHQSAMKPLMHWTAEGTHNSRNPGKVIKNLSAVAVDVKPVISPPHTGAGVSNQVCFAFSCDSTTPDKGYDGRQFNNWKKVYEPCKRHHIDLADSTL
jgi:hypothetical protein